MLKFIGKVYRLCRVRKAFQNILCWSLSISVFLVFLDWSYFKTSYVEVYLSSTNIPKGYLEFQNILCWSLSNFWKRSCYFRLISKHLMLKFIEDAAALTIYLKRFQNILCWSLSNTFRVPDRQILHFKTSYVEVYRVFRSRSISNYIISKHLMLKFINVLWTFVGLLKKISKHLMLKFIPHFLVTFIYFPLHFSWFLSFLPSISPYSFSYPISHKFPDFTILSQHFSFFRLVNISTTHNQAWGARQISSQLKMRDHKVGRSKTRLCMTKMGIDPIYPQIIIKHTITNLFFIFKAK